MSNLPVVLKHSNQETDTFFVAGRVPARVLFFNFIAYFLIACVLRFGVLPVMTTAFIGGATGDAGLYVWLIKSNLRDLFRLQWFSTTAFYPYTLSLGWSDNYILPSLLAAPFLKLGFPLPLVYNIMHLCAMALNGLSVYVLLTHLTNFPKHAFFAGVAFLSLGVFAAHLGHPQLQWAFYLPLLLVGVTRMIHERSVAAGVLTGLFFSAALATTAYYAVFGAVLCAGFLAAIVILRPERFLDARYFKPLGGAILGLIPAIPLLIPYFSVRGVFGGREVYEAHYFSAAPLGYLSAAPFSWLYSWTAGWSHSEAQLFPGLVLLILPALTLRRLWEVPPLRRALGVSGGLIAVVFVLSLFAKAFPWLRVVMAICSWGLLGSYTFVLYKLGRLELQRGFRLITNRSLIAAFSWLGLLFFLISVGPLGNPEKGQVALGVYQFFYWFFPGFDAVRAIGRAGIVTSLMLVVLYALYLTHYVRATGVFLVLTGAVIIENLPREFPIERLAPKPSVFSRLESIPDARDAAVVLPLATQFDEYRRVRKWSEYANLNIEAMLWGFDSGRFFVNGYSGQRSKVMRELPWSLSGFPDSRALNALGKIGGLRYIVFRGDRVDGFNKQAFEAEVKAADKRLKVVAVNGTDYLFEFSPLTQLSTPTEVLFPPLPGAEIELSISDHSAKKETALEVVIGNLDFKSFAVQGATTNKVLFKLPDSVAQGRPVVVSIAANAPAELVRARVLSGQFLE